MNKQNLSDILWRVGSTIRAFQKCLVEVPFMHCTFCLGFIITNARQFAAHVNILKVFSSCRWLVHLYSTFQPMWLANWCLRICWRSLPTRYTWRLPHRLLLPTSDKQMLLPLRILLRINVLGRFIKSKQANNKKTTFSNRVLTKWSVMRVKNRQNSWQQYHWADITVKLASQAGFLEDKDMDWEQFLLSVKMGFYSQIRVHLI